MWPDRPDFIAIDGKTARRTHDKRKGVKALHTLSAYATTSRLVLAQRSVPEKTNEITAIPELLDDLAGNGQLKVALVTIDAMGCQVEIADRIVEHKADYLLALKGNQPTLEAEVADYFHTAPPAELVSKTTVEKGHGRIETRIFTASAHVDWIKSERSYPGEPRFTSIKTILRVEDRTEYADKCTRDTRLFISSAPLDIERLAQAARGHWGVESMHWLLDCEFAEDLSRYRSGHGAKNMTVVRRFALGLVRANKSKRSVKTRRKAAGWNPEFLLEILQLRPLTRTPCRGLPGRRMCREAQVKSREQPRWCSRLSPRVAVDWFPASLEMRRRQAAALSLGWGGASGSGVATTASTGVGRVITGPKSRSRRRACGGWKARRACTSQ
jgi:predicted transposase YbfD/YdcC